MSTQSLYSILPEFCDANEDRLMCTKPFMHSGDAFGTDGKILVRIFGCDGTLEELNNSSVARAKDLCDPSKFQDGFVTLELSFDDTQKFKCQVCCGTGKIKQYAKSGCPECDGDGEFFNGSHKYECAECEGSGEVESDSGSVISENDCDSCGGSGNGYHIKTLPDGRSFQVKYLRKILSLPNVEYFPDASGGKYDKPSLKFRFDGGVGVLMPIFM